MIFDGTLKADQRVPQDAIADRARRQPLPVREALIALEADGLVASEPHRGTFVVPIRSEDIDRPLPSLRNGTGPCRRRRGAAGSPCRSSTRLDELAFQQMSSSDDRETAARPELGVSRT